MMTLHIGFTGTQLGMTSDQSKKLEKYLCELKAIDHMIVLHIGDCIGADSEAAYIALKLGIDMVCHPPIKSRKRAFFKLYSSTREPKDYLVRNKDIVNESSELIAAPSSHTERLRSGTWSTIIYARKCNKPIKIIYPYERKIE